MTTRQSLAAHGITAATLIVGGLWIGLLAGELALERATGVPVPSCLFKRITGHPCPTCGSTRSASALLQGDITEAVSWNPLAVALGAATLFLAVIKLISSLSTSKPRPLTWAQMHPGTLTIILLIVVAANWAYVIWHGN